MNLVKGLREQTGQGGVSYQGGGGSPPAYGLIAPDKFIPMAEKTGLIVPIGEWVLEEACRQVREWHLSGWTMAVNLSALQFCNAGLIQTVRDTLQRHNLDATT